jgi:drug/metabolite transporter (DMT)-like permease
METGLILALLASFIFAICAVVIRKASAIAGEAFTSMAYSVFVGLPYFVLVLTFTNRWNDLSGLTWLSFILLGAAGIIHLILGRGLTYRALRLVGANKTMPFVTANPIFTVILGIIFLSEQLTGFLAFGLLFILLGSGLVTFEKSSVATEKSSSRFSTDVKGLLAAIGGALCWGTTPVVVKLALNELGSPYAGSFVSYAVAFVVAIGLLAFSRQNRRQVFNIPFRQVLVPILIGAVLTSTGQLLAYLSLTYAPASMLAPLMATQGLFIFMLSFLVNRKIEVFTPKVIIGTLATVAGTVLIFQ